MTSALAPAVLSDALSISNFEGYEHNQISSSPRSSPLTLPSSLFKSPFLKCLTFYSLILGLISFTSICLGNGGIEYLGTGEPLSGTHHGSWCDRRTVGRDSSLIWRHLDQPLRRIALDSRLLPTEVHRLSTSCFIGVLRVRILKPIYKRWTAPFEVPLTATACGRWMAQATSWNLGNEIRSDIAEHCRFPRPVAESFTAEVPFLGGMLVLGFGVLGKLFCFLPRLSVMLTSTPHCLYFCDCVILVYIGIQSLQYMQTYQLGRAFTAVTLKDDTVDVARRHALQLIKIEQKLGIFWETSIQRRFLVHSLVMPWINRIYSFIHIPGTIAFLVWLYYYTTVRNRIDEAQTGKPKGDVKGSPAGPLLYQARRRTLAVCNLLAFVVFTLWPCMPPRLLSDTNADGEEAELARSFGFVDTVHGAEGARSVWTENRFCNQYGQCLI